MTVFEMVKYHSQEYPADIPLRIEECAAHMDISQIKSSLFRSMHTEYSYGKRKFDSKVVAAYPALLAAHRDFVPQLWHSAEWSQQFANFLITLTAGEVPAVIEIHPPFSDYSDITRFVENYKVFEEIIVDCFPQTEILIENRCGSVYKGGRFVISKLPDVENLCEQIAKHDLQLKVAYDVPQIYTAHNAKKRAEYIDLLRRTRNIRAYIGGVHLWGKRKSESGRLVSHCGDLNSYFSEDAETKALFLEEFTNCFDDGICRKMVLEVNSGNEDLQSIIADLVAAGERFV